MSYPNQIRLLILNYEYPPLGGGAGIISKKLAEEFAAIGHQVTVLTTWFAGQEEKTVKGNLTIIRLKSYRKKTDRSNPIEMFAWMLKALKYCRKNISKNEFDLCQANFTLPGGPVGYYLKKHCNIPYVILSHGHDIPWYFPKQMFLLHLLFYIPIKFYCLQSFKNILLTTDMKKIADGFLGKKHADKNIIIHNGMDLSNIDWGLKKSKINIIFVGRMVAQKDPIQFLEVVRKLNKKGFDATYKMFGDGPMMDKVEAKIKEDNLYNVILAGKVDNKLVLEEMKSSHIMIQPSLHEAMSVSVLEAISSGVYVITTPVSGNKQIIINGLNGQLVDHGDADAIVEEVQRFCQNDFENRYGLKTVQAYEQLNKLYGWESVLSLYDNLFKEVSALK